MKDCPEMKVWESIEHSGHLTKNEDGRTLFPLFVHSRFLSFVRVIATASEYVWFIFIYIRMHIYEVRFAVAKKSFWYEMLLLGLWSLTLHNSLF